uniref:Uncharacterized protein n=1 Tax=Rhodosorus marinus TaxID=101924 RepID=A0A7S2ZVV0_9RHOD
MRTVERRSYEASHSPQVHPQRMLTRAGHTVEGESELPRSVSDTAPFRCIADLLASDASARLSACVDLAVTCPVASAHHTAAALRQGVAASALRRVKERRYAKRWPVCLAVKVAPTGSRLSLWKALVTWRSGVRSGCGKCFNEHPTEYLELLRRISVALWRYSGGMLAEARHRRLRLHASLPSS